MCEGPEVETFLETERWSERLTLRLRQMKLEGFYAMASSVHGIFSLWQSHDLIYILESSLCLFCAGEGIGRQGGKMGD